MILSLGKVDNISFHINLVSHLAALVCQPGVHRNKDRRKQLKGRNLVISLYYIILDDIFIKNGAKCFHNDALQHFFGQRCSVRHTKASTKMAPGWITQATWTSEWNLNTK